MTIHWLRDFNNPEQAEDTAAWLYRLQREFTIRERGAQRLYTWQTDNKAKQVTTPKENNHG